MRTDQTKRHALATASFTRILLLGVLLSLFAPALFAGDQVEKFDLVVIGVMPNFLGPKQSIILVQLLGPKVEHTGVVAGMSGSPVYLEGKLAGALSLKLGIFTKEPLAGVTPIENMLSLPKGSPTGTILAGSPQGAPGAEEISTAQLFDMPTDWTSRLGVPG